MNKKKKDEDKKEIPEEIKEEDLEEVVKEVKEEQEDERFSEFMSGGGDDGGVVEIAHVSPVLEQGEIMSDSGAGFEREEKKEESEVMKYNPVSVEEELKKYDPRKDMSVGERISRQAERLERFNEMETPNIRNIPLDNVQRIQTEGEFNTGPATRGFDTSTLERGYKADADKNAVFESEKKKYKLRR